MNCSPHLLPESTALRCLAVDVERTKTLFMYRHSQTEAMFVNGRSKLEPQLQPPQTQQHLLHCWLRAGFGDCRSQDGELLAWQRAPQGLRLCL
jgi:hypothetical protein